MDLNFTVNNDGDIIEIIFDNSMTLKAQLNDNDEISFKNFEKIDDETIEQTLKKMCRMLFAIYKYE